MNSQPINNFKNKNTEDLEPTVIQSTQRKDGTWRKEIKIRPGYINDDQQKAYVIPQRRNQEECQEYIKQNNGGQQNIQKMQKINGNNQNYPSQNKINTNTQQYKPKFYNSQKNTKNHPKQNKNQSQSQTQQQQQQKIPDIQSEEFFPGLGDPEPKLPNKQQQQSQQTNGLPKNNNSQDKNQENNNVFDMKEVERQLPQLLSAKEKETKKLQKKLKQIEALEEKQDRGIQLNEEESEKIESKQGILNKLQDLEKDSP